MMDQTLPNRYIQPIPDQRTQKGDIDTTNGNQILLPQYVQIDNFLSPDQHDQALQIALKNEHHFKDSEVRTSKGYVDKRIRRSSILKRKYHHHFHHFLREQVLSAFPAVMEQLGQAPFEVKKVNIQLTAHNDQGFYLPHSDSSNAATETREITFVYYFYREPKAFSGGELNLYQTIATGEQLIAVTPMEMIEPQNNSIVFFPSLLLHEVAAVSCPSQGFADSRFTFNGWIYR